MATIALHLDRGDVSVNDFTDALSAQVSLVHEIMAAMGIAANDVRWVITNLEYGSASAAAASQILNDRLFMADIEEAVSHVGAGVVSLATSSERPKYFNDEALKLSRKLVNIAIQSEYGRSRYTFGDTSITPTEAVSANIEKIIKSDLRSIGSIEGTLIGVEGSDGAYRISVKDRLRGRRVPCKIPPDMLRRALDNFESRVTVRGVLWSRSDGTPVRIDVRDFELMPSDDELPTAREIRGILRDFQRADGE